MSKLFASKKGQSAMEYLMIYGWALIAIVVVVGILYMFLPKGSQQCDFEVQGRFLCNQPSIPSIQASDGLIRGALFNGGPQKVRVLGVLCTQNATQPAASAFPTISVPLSPRVSKTFAGAAPGGLGDVKCTTSAGGFSSGETFKGYIYVKWQYDPEADPASPPRYDRAILVTTAG